VSKEAGKSDSSPRHKSEHQSQCQQQCIYSSKAEPSSCSCESCGSRRCSSSSGRYHWYDSRASHSFVAANFVQKHNLPLSMLKNWMIVSSPGGDMHARHVCPKVSILIRGVEFLANLIVLESKGIHVILGMDWLSKHK
jgi:hypothetical protein